MELPQLVQPVVLVEFVEVLPGTAGRHVLAIGADAGTVVAVLQLRSESITAIRACALGESCDCLAPEAGPVESAGPLTAADCFPRSSWVRWSVSLTDD